MNDRRKKFLDNNMLMIDGEVDLEMARYVSESMEHFWTSGNPPIQVLIGSGGGDVDFGLYIYDMIDTYKGKSYGRVVTHARSVAAIILQACSTREAGRHSKILIHNVNRKQVSFDVLTNAAKLEELVVDMKKSQEKLYKILESRTGKSRDEIVKACLSNTDMTAEEALNFGLISSITPSAKKDDGENPTPDE